MRGLYGAVLGLGALSAVGCTSGISSSTEGLYVVSGDVTSRADLFLDRSIDARPLTEAQLVELGGGLSADALPVDVSLEGDALIATVRGTGEIAGTWPVLGVIQPIGNELDNTGGPVYTPDGHRYLDVGELPSDLTRVDLPIDIIVDFGLDVDRSVFEEPELWQDLNRAHPGCA